MVGEKKRKKQRMGEQDPEEVLQDEPEGQAKLVLERPRKKKKPRKNVLPPSIIKISAIMRDMEEDPKDKIPLSQRIGQLG